MAREKTVRTRGALKQCERDAQRRKPSRQKRSIRNSARPTRILPEDDELLIKLREERGLTWKQIGEYFPGRTVNSLQGRYRN